MTFANFIFVVFLLLSLLVFAVLVLLVRQIKKDGRLPPEKLSTLTAILFIPALIIFALVFKGIAGWRSNIQLQNNQIEVGAFVKSVYQPLAVSQQKLHAKLSETNSLLLEIESMELTYPNHVELVRHVKKQWKAGQAVLFKTYHNTDKQIRRAWIAHNTMDREDVLSKFSKQAVHLEVQIHKAEKKYLTHIYSVQTQMVRSLDQARRLLDSHRKPARTKKGRLANKLLSEKIRPFSSTTSAEIIGYLSLVDVQLQDEIATLQQLIRHAGQQMLVLNNHLYKNRDLKLPLTKAINDWKLFEEVSKQQLQQILFAIEAEFVARKLGLSGNSPAVRAMHKSLLIGIPAIVGKAHKKRKAIDQSYNIKGII